MSIRPLLLWSRFRITTNRQLWEILTASPEVDAVVIWTRDFLADEPLPEGLAQALEYKVIGARELSWKMGWQPLLQLVYSIFTAARRADCIIAATHNDVHAKIGLIAAKLWRIPVAMVVEVWVPGQRRSWVRRALRAANMWTLRRCDYVFVHGSRQEAYVRQVAGVPRHRVLVWPHLSQDLRRKDCTLAAALRSQYALNGKQVILYLGRIVPRKGLLDLIHACHHVATVIDNAVLLVGGAVSRRGEANEDSPDAAFQHYYDACQSAATRCKMPVMFVGEIAPDLNQNYFAIADLFVHPHSNYHNQVEGWGLVVNEALSMGLPVITTDRVASAELITNGWNGYVVQAGDVMALSQRIIEVLSDKNLQRKFGQNSRRSFEAYQNSQRTIAGIALLAQARLQQRLKQD
jgi:glycosyltransferase involved in cell wall biosynthesis